MDEQGTTNTPPSGSTLAGAAVAAPVLTVQTPAHGGSYINDDATGTLTLVEQTKQPG